MGILCYICPAIHRTRDSMAENTRAKKSGILLAIIIVAVAVAIIAWQAFDVTGWAIPFIILLIIGLYLIVSSFFMPRSSSIGPSPASFYIVNGTVLTVIGIIGTVNLATDLEWWYSVVACLFVAAALVLFISLQRD